MKMLTFILAAILASGCSSQKDENKIILDVNAVANKRPDEVEKLIGPPDSLYSVVILGDSIFCQRYKKHNIEIQYPEGLATDIVIYGPHHLPFNQTALKAFNIDYSKQHPSYFMKNRLIRWSDLDAFSAITFYNPQKDSLNTLRNFNIFFKAKGQLSR